MKKDRLDAVRRIVTENSISTQDELIELLEKEGYVVTQATASRDINQLGLIKINDHKGRTKYVFPEKSASSGNSTRYITILREAIVSVAEAANLVVVKCHTGMAVAACECIDVMLSDNIVGTISGDNTFFIATESNENAKSVINEINSILDR